MYSLASRPHTTLMYSFGYTSLYSYTAIQRDTSDLMYHHPSDATTVVCYVLLKWVKRGSKAGLVSFVLSAENSGKIG